MTVADRIKTRREQLDMSQEELAAKMGLKDKSSISKIESSGNRISLKNIEKIAPILQCSVPYLMGWEELGIPSLDHLLNLSIYEHDPVIGELRILLENATPRQKEQLLEMARILLKKE